MLALAFRVIGLVVASTHAVPFRLAEELLIRDLEERGAMIGKCSDPADVMFMFDTSDGAGDQFETDKKFAAEACRFLSPDVKIIAAVYGKTAVQVKQFSAADAEQELKGVTNQIGGKRNAAKAITFAKEQLKRDVKKIVVLFVSDKLADKSAAETAASKAKNEKFLIYGAIPVGKYESLNGELSGIITDNGHSFVETKDMTIAEDFQIDLNVKYGGC